ncbi:uncharacterized protein LOC116304180 [Actinia tenebrosa]|uniref:Uncharacterized protein LOC116304180 n=1 Tax=Actinia tenebrosa TaxID=6105 RepID=A0A6P8IS61_ACTTE|nr:uncharacterized protein LOC116304180 [Actinia tenebrosa]
MAEEEEKKDKTSSNSYSDSAGETIKHIDRLVLLHFFVVFVSSFALGLLFLHSSLTFWRTQFEGNGYYENLFYSGSSQSQFLPKDNTVSMVSYNVNSTFSLVR